MTCYSRRLLRWVDFKYKQLTFSRHGMKDFLNNLHIDMISTTRFEAVTSLAEHEGSSFGIYKTLSCYTYFTASYSKEYVQRRRC